MTKLDDRKQAVLPGTTPEDRRRLLDQGYVPLPILGKFPRWKGWSSGEVTAERLDAIEIAHPDHTGTGLRTGALAVADIDLTDLAHVRAVEEVIEGTRARIRDLAKDINRKKGKRRK